MKKRGLSPVIATVLLVVIVLVIIVIIYFWASSFLKERAQKFDEPIENACEEINIEVEAVGNTITVQNNGNVPLHGISVRKKEANSVTSVGDFYGVSQTVRIIKKGYTGSFTASGLSQGTTLYIRPIILGELKTQEMPHICEEELEIKVE